MALKLPSSTDTFKVIARIDTAVSCTAEAYSNYLDTLDESLLNLTAEPTRFVMRKVLPYRAAQGVQNQQFRYAGGEVQLQPAFMLEEVRCSVVGIENPSNVEPDEKLNWEAHSDGYTSFDLMAKLQGAGVVMDLYRARQTAVGPRDNQEALKKK